MNLNLTLILIFVLLGVLISLINPKNIKKHYIVSCSLFLILSVTLRSLSYGAEGADTWNYFRIFKDTISTSWGDIIENWWQRYSSNLDLEAEIGFMLLQKLIGTFTNSYHVFTTIADLLFFIPFGILLNKYCKNILEILFGFVFYIALVHTFALYGGRQFFAMGFGIMFFLCYDEKKYWGAAVALLFGFSIHRSLLLILLPFLLSFLSPKWLKRIHIITFIVFPIVALFPNQIIVFMGNFIGLERYVKYGTREIAGGATTFIIMMEALSLLTLLLTKTQWLNDSHFKNLYAMIPCLTFFAPLIVSNGTMIRIAAYFYIYLTVLLPNILRKSTKNAYILIFIFCVALSFLILKGGSYSYDFFWRIDPPYTW